MSNQLYTDSSLARMDDHLPSYAVTLPNDFQDSLFRPRIPCLPLPARKDTMTFFSSPF